MWNPYYNYKIAMELKKLAEKGIDIFKELLK